MTPTPMETLLTSLGAVVTAVLGYIGTIATKIVETPLLLLTVGIFFLGACIGIFVRMLRSA